MNKISEAIENACKKFSSHDAIIVDNEKISYQELLNAINKFGEQWVSHPEKRIAIIGKNNINYIVQYYALVKAGKIPFLIDYQITINEFLLLAKATGISHVLLDLGKQADFADAVLVHAHDWNDFIYGEVSFQNTQPEIPLIKSNTHTCRFTSGTTGVPKCIEFSDVAITNAAMMWSQGIGLDEKDHLFCLAALSNGLAFNTSLLASFISGATLHLTKGMITPGYVANYVKAKKISYLIAFPTIYRLIAQASMIPEDAFTHLKIAISAGAKLWDWVNSTFQNRFSLRIADYYGIAETGPVTFERDRHYHEGLGTVLPGAEIKILSAETENGEILVKTASMASSYLNFPGMLERRIDSAGFYHSGDLGYLKNDRLFVVGRNDQMINVGGRKVDPSEITDVVLTLPEIQDAVAFSVEDDAGEMAIQLFIQVKDKIAISVVKDFCRSRLSLHKIPTRVQIVEKILRNEVGKPLINEMKNQYLKITSLLEQE